MGLFWGDTVEEEDTELRNERQIVAYHEAGHIIACNEHGIPYTDVTVSVSRTYWTGQLRSSGHVALNDNAFYQYDRSVLAITALAGPATEALYYMEELGWRKSKAWREAESYSGVDLHNAQVCVGRSGLSKAERSAQYLIESHWRSVARLAAQL